ncbi:septum formation initiator family protein [Streptomyces sp. NPDC006512]|uniref:septum formation initiator family protein n=1 Tax=Streptomyces sp. NPDC006512 TaxID=3154307 RepID=UPI0033AE6B96
MSPAGRSGGGKAAGKVATLTRGQAARIGRALGSGPAARPAGGGPPGQAARMPFVLLVVALLGGGLISLLLLNSALNEGSFQLSNLKKETTALTDEEQALQRDVDGYSAPDALQRRAHELGLVPGGSPVFIGPDGKVAGTVSTAEAPPPPSPPPSAQVPPVQNPAPSGAPASPGQAPAPSGGPAPAPSGSPASPPPAAGGPSAPAGSPQPPQQSTPDPGR